MRQIDTIIIVEDIKKIKQFYSEKLKLEILFDWETMIIYKNRLAFHEKGKLLPEGIGDKLFGDNKINKLIIYLGIKNIEEEFIRINNLGIEVVHGIIDLPWQKIFRIKDIEGNIVEIGEEKES